ncbi:MAG: hypothetical protein V4671_05965, partial [Armatimonadota bacterium]
MVRSQRSRQTAWLAAAGIAGVLVVALVVLRYVAFTRPSAGTAGNAATAPLIMRFGMFRSGSVGGYFTPVGQMTFRLPEPSDTSFVYGPVLGFASVLNLSSDQRTRIWAIQQETQRGLKADEQQSALRMNAIFNNIRQTGQSFRGVLPFSDPVSQNFSHYVHRTTEPWRRQRMEDLLRTMRRESIEVCEQWAQREKRGSDAIEALLTGSQRASLRQLLENRRVCKQLSLEPADRYAALGLSDDQRARLWTLAEQVKRSASMPLNRTPFPVPVGPIRFGTLTAPQRMTAQRQQRVAAMAAFQQNL